MAQHADADETKHISNGQCWTLQTKTMAHEAGVPPNIPLKLEKPKIKPFWWNLPFFFF